MFADSSSKRSVIILDENMGFWNVIKALEIFSHPLLKTLCSYSCQLMPTERKEDNSNLFGFGNQLGSYCIELLGSFNRDILLHSDFIIIPDWLEPLKQPNKEIIAALTQAYQHGNKLIALGSGSYLLGHCGLIDYKEVTTKPNLYKHFKQTFNKAKCTKVKDYTQDQNIYCSQGDEASVSLGLMLIEQYISKYASENICQYYNSKNDNVSNKDNNLKNNADTSIHSSYSKHTKRLMDTIEWANKNLNHIEKVDQLAEKTHLSRRSFDRLFRKLIGMSPKAWLTQKKLEKAKHCLEENVLTIEEVAEVSGFGSSVNLRNNFQQNFGLSPTDYRKETV